MAELNGNHTRKSLISLLKTYERDLQLSIKSITDYLEENGMSDISSDVGATNLSLPPTAPTSVLEARQNLISSAYTIQQIATEPAEYIPYLAIHVSTAHSNIRWERAEQLNTSVYHSTKYCPAFNG
jgi:transcriptional antiterminator